VKRRSRITGRLAPFRYLPESKMNEPDAASTPSSTTRSATPLLKLRTCFGLLCGLRRHDFRAARTWINTMYPESSLPGRDLRFVFWSLGQLWRRIPDTLAMTTFAAPVSRTPFWLAQGNPLENHPWREHPDARLPARSQEVVTRVPDGEAGVNQPSRFITAFVLGELRRYFGLSRVRVTNEWSGAVNYTPDEFPIVGVMDGHRQYIIAGMAGSGTAVSFNGGRCIVNRIERTAEADDYPAEYFSPTRLLNPRHHSWPELDSQQKRQ
jgi:hypothetical protein